MKKFVYNLIFYFVHMSVLLVCVSVSYMHAVFMGAREGFRSLGAGVTDGCELFDVVMQFKLWSSRGVAKTLNG